MFKKLKIRSKFIIIFVIVVGLSVAAISFNSFHVAEKSLKHARIEALRSIADTKFKTIERFFYERKGDIHSAQNFYNIRINMPIMVEFTSDQENQKYLNAKKMLDKQLREYQKAYEYIDIMFVNKGGIIIYSTNELHFVKDMDQSFLKRQPKAFIEGKKGIYFSDIYKNKDSDYKFGMYITAPIFDFNEKLMGVIAFEVGMKPIFEFIQDTTGLGDTGETLLGKGYKEKALFLNPLRHDKDAALNRWVTYEHESAFPIKEAVSGRNGFGLSVDYRGKNIIAAWRYLPTTDWGLVAKIDTEEAFAPVRRLKILVVIIAGVTFFLAFLILYFLTRSIIRPVIKLSDVANKIALGDLDHQIDVISQDEIGVLSHAFNKMAISLKDFRENLIAANKANEKKNEDLKNLLLKLKESQNIIVQTEKMSAIGTLTAGIAHELNNPMMGLINFVQYCLKHTSPEDRRYEVLKDAERETKRCIEIVNNLLTFSHTDNADELKGYKNVSCQVLLDRALRLLTYFIIKQNITVNKQFYTIPDIYVKEPSIQQLFLNLLTNAIDSLENSNEKVINIAIKPAMEFNCEFVSITINDTGSGITSENLKNIFDPFFTTKPVGKGTGLGLSICNNIVKAHKGTFSCESELGKGTTFKILLPVKT